MSFKATVEIGDIYYVGEHVQYPELEDIHLVICMPPNESLLNTGKLFVAPAYKGQPHSSFQSSLWDTHYVNCSAAYPIDAIQLKKFTYVERMSDDQINEMEDAMSYAERHRKFRL